MVYRHPLLYIKCRISSARKKKLAASARKVEKLTSNL